MGGVRRTRMAVLERRLPDIHSTSPLLQYASNVHSQGGEDGILDRLLQLVGTGPKHCIDIGAWDGVHLSNTRNLLKQDDSGWSGMLAEANPDRASQLQQLYCHRPTVACVCTWVELNGPNSLCSLLERYECPDTVDVLSIDVDGADYHIWAGLPTDRFRARIVVIEFNPTIPNTVLFIQAEDMRVQQGSSLVALAELGRQKGYSLVCCTTFNAIFVSDELAAAVGMQPPGLAPRDLHAASMSTDFFQLYDGELRLSGPTKLLWHRLGINQDKMQVLPRRDRKFPFAPPFVDAIHSCEHAVALMIQQARVPVADEQLVTAAGSVLEATRPLLGIVQLQGIAAEAVALALHLASRCSDQTCVAALRRVASAQLIAAAQMNIKDPDRARWWQLRALFALGEVAWDSGETELVDQLMPQLAGSACSRGEMLEYSFWSAFLTRSHSSNPKAVRKLASKQEQKYSKLAKQWEQQSNLQLPESTPAASTPDDSDTERPVALLKCDGCCSMSLAARSARAADSLVGLDLASIDQTADWLDGATGLLVQQVKALQERSAALQAQLDAKGTVAAVPECRDTTMGNERLVVLGTGLVVGAIVGWCLRSIRQ